MRRTDGHTGDAGGTKGRLLSRAVLVALTTTILAIAGVHPAAAQPPAFIDASAQSDTVGAHAFIGGASLTYTIRATPGGTVLFTGMRTADPTGNSFLGPPDHGLNLVAGNSVEVGDGTTTKELTLKALAVTNVDRANETVSGTADPNQGSITVNVFKPPAGNAQLVVTADGSGNWTADFSTVPFDIDGQTSANVNIADGDNDLTSAGLQYPKINASLSFDGVNLGGFNPGVAVSFSISGSTSFGPQNFIPDANGNALVDRSVHGVDIVPGLTLTATQGSLTKTLTTANIAITDVNPTTDDVTGTAPPNAPVFVGVNDPPSGGGSGQQVTADGAGNWTADFTGLFDITPGTSANAGTPDADGDNTSYDKQPPTVHASLTFDQIDLHGFTPGTAVSVTVSNGGSPVFGPQNFTPDPNGDAHIRPDVLHLDIVPGLTIDATQGAVTKTLVTVNVAITGVNPAADVVTGTAPPNATVQVNVNTPTGPGPFKTVTADGTGNWTADFAGSFDVTLGTFIQAGVPDADGDTTHFERQPPVIRASLTFDNISVDNFTPGTPVSLTVSNGGSPVFGPQNFTPDSQGHVFVDQSIHGLDIVPGLVIDVTQGSLSKSLTTVALTITDVNASTDDVVGTAPANATVQVNVHDGNNGTFKEVTADAGGNWTADFSGAFDITGATAANADVPDADGDQTGFDKEPPRIEGNLTYDSISGENFTPNSSVTVDIRSAPGVNPPLYSGAASTDGFGNFNLDFDVHNQNLAPGMEVTVTGSTKVLALVPLTIDTVDAATDDVSGTAAPGATVDVSVGDQADKQVTANGSGDWTADFSGVFDILAGQTVANAAVSDADGDRTTVEKQPPRIDASLNDDGVGGEGFTPNSTVTVEIRSAQGVNPPLFRDTAIPTDGAGSFFVEPFRHNLDLVPGMAITAIGSTKLLVLANLSLSPINPATDVIAGTGPPNTTVFVDVSGPGGDAQRTVTSSGSGAWSANFTGLHDVIGGDDVRVFVQDADRDTTSTNHNVPNIQFVSLSHGTICVDGFFGPATVTIDSAAGKRLWRGTLPVPDNCAERSTTGVDLAPGMTVSATDGTITKNLTLVPIGITSVDATSNVATGTASPGANVVLNIGGPFERLATVTAGGSGTWSFDFDDVGRDFTPDESVWAIVLDADGDGSQAERAPPSIQADLTFDRVEGCGFALRSSVTVTINAFVSGSVPTDGGGCFAFDASAQDLRTGKTVSVTDGTTTRQLDPLPVLTMNVDLAGDVVTGTAPPFAQVDVGFGVVDCPCGDGKTVAADASGNWTASFGQDLGPNLSFGATIHDADGDRTSVAWRADLKLSAGTYAVQENAGAVTITVQRIGTEHVTVGTSYGTSNGSATAGSDYTATSGALSFADGVTTQTFTVPIVNDTAVEGDETFTVALSNPTGGGALVAPLTATITIKDDDSVPPTLAFSAATYNVGEGGGKATITVVRTGNTGVPVTVSYAASDGTATSGADYAPSSGTLAFAAGQTTKTFDVRMIEDGLYEGDETVNLTLSAPTGGAILGSPSAATLTIVDNETAPKVQFAQAVYNVSENVGAAVVTVVRAGPLGNAFTVNYQLEPGTTATIGSDFTFAAGTLSFGKNDSSKTISIPIINDGATESAENIVVQLTAPTGGVPLGSPSQTTVVIAANDQQPDAMVGSSPGGGFIGDNVYNTTGAGQTFTTNGFRNATTVVFFRIQNDGTTPNTIFVAGSPAPTKGTLRYFLQSDGSELTSLIQAGTYQITLPPGAFIVIRAELAISTKAKVGAPIGFSLTARWTGDVTLQDTATANVNVAG